MPKGFQGFQKGNQLRKGIPASTKGKVKMDHPSWKGEEVSYRVLHKWVVRHKGRPEICEHCGKTGLKGKKINWANKNHTPKVSKFKRNLEDWIRLCTKCHYAYDRKK